MAIMTAPDTDTPSMYVPRMDAVLNRWFRSYAEASASLESEGGYWKAMPMSIKVTDPPATRVVILTSWDRRHAIQLGEVHQRRRTVEQIDVVSVSI